MRDAARQNSQGFESLVLLALLFELRAHFLGMLAIGDIGGR